MARRQEMKKMKKRGIKISQPVLIFLACVLLVGAVIVLVLTILLCGAWLNYNVDEVLRQWFQIDSGLGF